MGENELKKEEWLRKGLDAYKKEHYILPERNQIDLFLKILSFLIIRIF